ncbi:MAG: hypothetical protein K2N38_12580 [Oscillospiraceae bacterium]|nr:hypothetical protein [Oscillospiraceae bacterium]
MNDSSEKGMGVLCYIPFICLIPVITGSTPFVKYHANQGLVLFIMSLIFGAVSTICSLVLRIIPILGGIVSGIISGVLGLVVILFVIFGIVNVVNGETKPLPIIGGITILK